MAPNLQCALLFKRVEFVGFVVFEYGVSVQTSKIDAVRDCLASTSIIELCFLSLAINFCQFV